ncbi:thioredoxin, mitochondrial-like [Ctenocephalides felis]|uniref:thioredoxin, mitochondrial-like n=1 Tax=Ctenocephalides felis TaxID=7515 RepID=UPI000E6E2472|nr:thioredoxin, mitochondrial-like [Ctenocephalides felis]
MLRFLRKYAPKQNRICLSLYPVHKKKFTVNNNEEFVDKVMNSKRAVIVNFHAEWCEPCKILTPKLSELLQPNEDVDLAIVDVESHVDLVHTFEVKAVPAVVAVKDGHVVDKFIGLVDANMIENLIKKLEQNDPQDEGK